MKRFFSQCTRWMRHVSSFLRLPSCSSATASFICCSKSSMDSSMRSHPAGGRLPLRRLRNDMARFRVSSARDRALNASEKAAERARRRASGALALPMRVGVGFPGSNSTSRERRDVDTAESLGGCCGTSSQLEPVRCWRNPPFPTRNSKTGWRLPRFTPEGRGRARASHRATPRKRLASGGTREVVLAGRSRGALAGARLIPRAPCSGRL